MWLHEQIDSLADIVRYYGRQQADRCALSEGRVRRSFGELDRNSSRVANALIAGGVAPGANLGFLGKNSIALFELLFGAAKAGCAFAPFNWRLAPPELAQVIDDARPALMLVDQDLLELALRARALCGGDFEIRAIEPSAGAGECALAAWIAGHGDTDPCVPVPADRTAVLLYTSGTSGRPKGVQLSSGAFNFMRLSEHLDATYTYRQDDTMLMVMPGFHLVGIGLALQALYGGAKISILAAMDPEKILDLIEQDRITVCVLVPTALQMLLGHPRAASGDFSSLRLVMYAGSPIESGLLRRALDTMKCDFMQFYGASETWTMALLRPGQHDPECSHKIEHGCGLECGGRLRSCGTPPPLVELKVVDGQGREVPDGTVGELLARSPTLFTGYLNQPAVTERAFADGWYRTGDAGFKCPSGLYFLVDRVKDMIVTGGENVYSVEVEQALAKHPGVLQVAVVGAPDPRWGEKVIAHVVLREGAALGEAELIAHCHEHIARYKTPKEIHFVTSLPMTSTGKVRKQQLRDASPT